MYKTEIHHGTDENIKIYTAENIWAMSCKVKSENISR